MIFLISSVPLRTGSSVIVSGRVRSSIPESSRAHLAIETTGIPSISSGITTELLFPVYFVIITSPDLTEYSNSDTASSVSDMVVVSVVVSVSDDTLSDFLSHPTKQIIVDNKNNAISFFIPFIPLLLKLYHSNKRKAITKRLQIITIWIQE